MVPLMSQSAIVCEHPDMHLSDHTCVYLYAFLSIFGDFGETKQLLVFNHDNIRAGFGRNNVNLLFVL